MIQSSLTRRQAAVVMSGAVFIPLLQPGHAAEAAETDPLPSWNDGPAKRGILDFVRTTTDKTKPSVRGA